MTNSRVRDTINSVVDRLSSRSVKPADGPAAAPLKNTTSLWEAVYGDARGTRQATVITVASDAEADALLAQPLTEAQKAGLAARAELGW